MNRHARRALPPQDSVSTNSTTSAWDKAGFAKIKVLAEDSHEAIYFFGALSGCCWEGAAVWGELCAGSGFVSEVAGADTGADVFVMMDLLVRLVDT